VQQNSDFIGGFVQDLNTAPGAGGAQRPPLSATAKREIGWSLYRFFSQDGKARSPEARDEAVRTIAQHTGLNETDARTRLDELARSYDRAQTDLKAARDRAEQKAREAADRAKGTVAKSAIWTVVAFVIGAFSAMWGGRRGASRAWEDVYPETRATVPPLT
jgi:cobalamin biosynthesis Mg chelatase CobN